MPPELDIFVFVSSSCSCYFLFWFFFAKDTKKYTHFVCCVGPVLCLNYQKCMDVLVYYIYNYYSLIVASNENERQKNTGKDYFLVSHIFTRVGIKNKTWYICSICGRK